MQVVDPKDLAPSTSFSKMENTYGTTGCTPDQATERVPQDTKVRLRTAQGNFYSPKVGRKISCLLEGNRRLWRTYYVIVSYAIFPGGVIQWAGSGSH